jgi:hypothetical protein
LRLQLELPRGARLALREILPGPASASTPVRRLRARVRQQVTESWAAAIQRNSKLDPRRARALAWMMTVASWSLFDLVADGTFTPDEAADFYVRAVTGAMTALESKER